MIFKTFDNDLTRLINKVGLFNKSLYNLGRDFKNGNGLFTSLFSGQSVTSKDIQSINEMNQAMKNGSTMAQAWCDNMKGCTVAAKQQAKQYLINKGNLSDLTTELNQNTLSAKAGQVALQELATAGNMWAMWAIAKGIQLTATAIDNYIHRVEKAQEALSESVSAYESTKSELSSINSELETQAKRMTELLARDKLTYAETDELTKLRLITQELELQKALKEEKTKRNAREVAQNTVIAYQTQLNAPIKNLFIDADCEVFKNTGVSASIIGNSLLGVLITAFTESKKLRKYFSLISK